MHYLAAAFARNPRTSRQRSVRPDDDLTPLTKRWPSMRTSRRPATSGVEWTQERS
jgi:hypothetical protein